MLGWVWLSSAALVEIVKKDSETERKKRGRGKRTEKERESHSPCLPIRGLTNIC